MRSKNGENRCAGITHTGAWGAGAQQVPGQGAGWASLWGLQQSQRHKKHQQQEETQEGNQAVTRGSGVYLHNSQF